MGYVFYEYHIGLSLLLSVCEQDISQSSEWIQTKFGGEIGCVTRKTWLDFGKDPDSDLDTRIFLSDSSSLRDQAKNDI